MTARAGLDPARRPVSLTNTTEQAFAGTRSLKTTGRTAGFNGPSLNLTGQLAKGATYQIGVSVRLVAGEAPTTIRVTMQRTSAAARRRSTPSRRTPTSPTAAWVTLNGTYSFSTDGVPA